MFCEFRYNYWRIFSIYFWRRRNYAYWTS